MFVIGLGTAAPAQRYAQRECWDAVQRTEPYARLTSRSHAILKKVLCSDNGIATRHLALDSLPEAFQLTPDTLQARFTKHAPTLAAEAAYRALQDAACAPSEIDAVLISTCTGYLCPGLTSYVSGSVCARTSSRWIWWGRVAALPCPICAPPRPCWPPNARKRCCRSASKFAVRRFIWMTIPVCSSVPACLATVPERPC